MERIFVKPAKAGAIVRHPEKQEHKLAQEGEWVVSSNQWRRYLKNGDVVLAEPPKEQEEVVPEEAKPKKVKAAKPVNDENKSIDVGVQ